MQNKVVTHFQLRCTPLGTSNCEVRSTKLAATIWHWCAGQHGAGDGGIHTGAGFGPSPSLTQHPVGTLLLLDKRDNRQTI